MSETSFGKNLFARASLVKEYFLRISLAKEPEAPRILAILYVRLFSMLWSIITLRNGISVSPIPC